MNNLPYAFIDWLAGCLTCESLVFLQAIFPKWSSLINEQLKNRVFLRFYAKPSSTTGFWEYALRNQREEKVQSLSMLNKQYVRFYSIDFQEESFDKWIGPVDTNEIEEKICLVLRHISAEKNFLTVAAKACEPLVAKITAFKHIFPYLTITYSGPMCTQLLRHQLSDGTYKHITLDGPWPESLYVDLKRYVLTGRWSTLTLELPEDGRAFDFQFVKDLFEMATLRQRTYLNFDFRVKFGKLELESYKKQLQTKESGEKFLTSSHGQRPIDSYLYLWIVKKREIAVSHHVGRYGGRVNFRARDVDK